MVLGHVVSHRDIEVDKVKIEVIERLSLPTCVKEMRCFLRHVGFYHLFIKDFLKSLGLSLCFWSKIPPLFLVMSV